MAESSKSSKPQKKRETWEEKEARLLRKNVYDHLAYYIQVQLPEKKFEHETSFPRGYRQHKSKSPPKLHLPRKENNNTRRKKTLKVKGSYSDKEAPKSSAAQKKLGNDRSSDSENESQSKDRKPDEKKAVPRSSSKRHVSRPSSRKKDHHHEMFRPSPYLTNPLAKDVGRSKTAESMRKEAVRVAATTTKLLGELSLAEVVAIQKYQSPTKSLLSCTSSMSEHPNGMLTSNKAVSYAVKHDDRKLARRYMSKKKRKEAERAKKQRHCEREELASSQSYQRKYQRPLTSFAMYESESSSDSTSTSGSTMRSHSSLSTVRKEEKSLTVPMQTQEIRDAKKGIWNQTEWKDSFTSLDKDPSTINGDRSNEYIKYKMDKSSLRNDEASTTNKSSSAESSDEATMELTKQLENISKTATSSDEKSSQNQISEHKEYASASNGVTESESDFSSQSSSSSSSFSDANGVTTSVLADTDDGTSGSRNNCISKTEYGIRSSSASSTVVENSNNQLSSEQVGVTTKQSIFTTAQTLGGQRSQSSESENSTATSDAETQNTAEIAVVATRSQEGQSSSSESIAPKSSRTTSETHKYGDRTQHRKSSSSSWDALPTQEDRKDSGTVLQNQTSDNQSETDNHDTSSMTSSLRRIIEEAQMSTSDLDSSFSSSSSENDDAERRTVLGEQIFGRSLPDLNPKRETTKANGTCLESGGEILKVDSFKS